MTQRHPQRRYSPIIAAVIGLAAFNARATSVQELMSTVPPPPRDVTTALSWLKDGKIVAPEYTRFKQALEAERASIVALNGGALPTDTLAPTLSAPESPEVQEAAKGYATYLEDNTGKKDPAMLLGKRARWLHAAMVDNFKALLGKMAPCPVPCADPAALAKNQPVQGERYKLGQQDLDQWTTLFLDWQKKRSAVVNAAQAQLAAAGEGAKASTPAGKTAVARYRAAMLREVELTLSVTELALKRTDAVERGDVDTVTASTYSPKPKKS